MPKKYQVDWEGAYEDFKRCGCCVREFREKHMHRFCSEANLPSLTWTAKRLRAIALARLANDRKGRDSRPGASANSKLKSASVQVFKLTPEILHSRKSSGPHHNTTETNGTAVDVLLPNGVKFRFSSGNPELFARSLISSFTHGGQYAD